MEYAKKTPLGYKTVSSSYDCSHVILTYDEYIKITAQRDNAERERDRAKERELQNTKKAREDAAREIAAYNQKAKEVILSEREKAAASVRDMQKLLDQEKNLNVNLRRIATERANKSRNRDKHEEGYLVLNWQPYSYKRIIKNGRKTEEIRYNLCRITIQTPWDCSLPESQIDRLVTEALQKGKLIVSDNPSVNWYKINIGLDQGLDSLEENEVMILTRQYRSNVKEGLWEVTLITNFEPVIMEKHRLKYV